LTDAVTVETTIGGPDVFRAIAKIALEFYLHSGGDRSHITGLVPYVKGEKELDIVWFHYPEPPVYRPAEKEVSHVIQVVGDPLEGIAYAYVELFNCYNYIVRLSGDYDGAILDTSYAFDLIAQRTLEQTPDLRLDREQLHALFDHKDTRPFIAAKGAMDRVAGIAAQRQTSAEAKRIVRRVVDKLEHEARTGTAITHARAVGYLAEALADFMFSRSNSHKD